MHRVLNNRDDSTQLVGNIVFRTRLDKPLHRLQSRNLGPPALGLLQNLGKHLKHLPRTLRSSGFNQTGHRTVHSAPHRLSLVHSKVQDSGDQRKENTFDTRSEGTANTLHKDDRRLTLISRFGGSPGKDNIDDTSILKSIKGAWGLFEFQSDTVGDRLGFDVGGSVGEGSEFLKMGGRGKGGGRGYDGRHCTGLETKVM